MKRNLFCKNLYKIACVSFLLFFLNDALAQTACVPKDTLAPLPEMFVPNSHAIKHRKEFGTPTYGNGSYSKKQAIQKIAPFTKFVLNYSQKAFENLFSSIIRQDAPGIRIYFGLYSKCESASLPIGDSMVILLYSTCYPNQEPDKYYFLTEGQDTVIKIDTICGNKWRYNYVTKVMAELKKTVDSVGINSTYNAIGREYLDTKNIYFGKDSIKHWFGNEENYQCQKHGINITGYKISFSAYTQDGNNFGIYAKRLHLQFDYIYEKDGQETVLILEQQGDFLDRLDMTAKLYETKKKESFVKNRKSFSGDNGQLCPTKCN